MSLQTELFLVPTERDKRRMAHADMEKRHKLDLVELRAAARHMAYSNIGNRHDEPLTATIDDVRDHLGIKTRDKHDRGNHYLGNVFKPKHWIFTGREAESRAKNSHARTVKIWKLNVVLWNKIKRERDEKAAAKKNNRMAS